MKRLVSWLARPLGWPLLGAGRFYQLFISPLKPPTCRYTPTCSEYFIQAVRLRGPAKGTWMGIRRVLRCHPFGGSGYDPVLPPSEGTCCEEHAPEGRLAEGEAPKTV